MDPRIFLAQFSILIAKIKFPFAQMSEWSIFWCGKFAMSSVCIFCKIYFLCSQCSVDVCYISCFMFQPNKLKIEFFRIMCAITHIQLWHCLKFNIFFLFAIFLIRGHKCYNNSPNRGFLFWCWK